MARPIKKGLQYFPLSVDEFRDIKIFSLIRKYGTKGYTVYMVILTYVYSNGYYAEIPKNMLSRMIEMLVGSECFEYPEEPADIVGYCGELGIFNKELLDNGIITSEEIQENYRFVTARRKVDKTKYWLLEDAPIDDEKAEIQ